MLNILSKPKQKMFPKTTKAQEKTIIKKFEDFDNSFDIECNQGDKTLRAQLDDKFKWNFEIIKSDQARKLKQISELSFGEKAVDCMYGTDVKKLQLVIEKFTVLLEGEHITELVDLTDLISKWVGIVAV